ncbi:DUF4232 domain-containing protein [Streptomyces aurantiacus]|uniref:DUF4232 domain-containing protein n=1 Tax=Streptomyces aurantiacus TaxID=47760 RepID=UPI0009974C72|nr:DUF4232 domain-containing protein [Streptomyces aurantiacus]
MTHLPYRRAAVLCALAILAAGCGQSAGSGRDGAGGPATRVAGQGGAPPTPSGPGPAPSYGVTPDTLPPDASDGPRYGDLTGPEVPERPAEASRDCRGKKGVLVEPGPVDAAMGLRAMTVTLTHCGTGTYRLNGYPDLRVLDADREPLDVRGLKGTDEITTGMRDPGPHPVALAPRQSATVAVVWRNTYTDTTNPAVHAPHLRVVAGPGAPARTVTPHGGIDLGSTGRIATTAWTKFTPA